MAPDQTSQVDVPNLLDTLFEEVTLPDPTKPEPNLRLYPEIILQKSEKETSYMPPFKDIPLSLSRKLKKRIRNRYCDGETQI